MQRPIRLDQEILVLGTIHTWKGLAEATLGGIDAAELRVDLLPLKTRPKDLAEITVPILLTVRRKDEGGGRELTTEQRAKLYRDFLGQAAGIDIEGRSLPEMAGTITEAKAAGKWVVVSFHDFEGTPSVKHMKALEKAGRSAGADIVKVAAKTETPGEVARLLEFLEGRTGPLSVMGMGTLGRASRLLFAKAGSVLNYGWLDRPQVPGQWSAREFKELFLRA